MHSNVFFREEEPELVSMRLRMRWNGAFLETSALHYAGRRIRYMLGNGGADGASDRDPREKKNDISASAEQEKKTKFLFLCP